MCVQSDEPVVVAEATSGGAPAKPVQVASSHGSMMGGDDDSDDEPAVEIGGSSAAPATVKPGGPITIAVGAKSKPKPNSVTVIRPNANAQSSITAADLKLVCTALPDWFNGTRPDTCMYFCVVCDIRPVQRNQNQNRPL